MSFVSLLKKDFRLMISGNIFLLVIGSLVLYSCYINFVYAKMDTQEYSVYLYNPISTQTGISSSVLEVFSYDELLRKLETDTSAIGIDASNERVQIIQYEIGNHSLDKYRSDYALSLLSGDHTNGVEQIGKNNLEMKRRKEMSCEVLFFEIVAVGFLGIASLLFKEKHMGVIRIHGVLPMKKYLFILSKLVMFLFSDICFAVLLLVINIGFPNAFYLLPKVILVTCILSILMALLGFGCAMILRSFKEFTMIYVFVTISMISPVFLAANTAISWGWIKYYPIYNLYMSLKNVFFGMTTGSVFYISCGFVLIALFVLVSKALDKEFVKEL